jgi:hypothetical protein
MFAGSLAFLLTALAAFTPRNGVDRGKLPVLSCVSTFRGVALPTARVSSALAISQLPNPPANLLCVFSTQSDELTIRLWSLRFRGIRQHLRRQSRPKAFGVNSFSAQLLHPP